MPNCTLQLYNRDEAGRSWTKLATDSGNLKYDSASVLDVFQEMCRQGRHRQLSDFDDHLNDLSRLVATPAQQLVAASFARSWQKCSYASAAVKVRLLLVTVTAGWCPAA